MGSLLVASAITTACSDDDTTPVASTDAGAQDTSVPKTDTGTTDTGSTTDTSTADANDAGPDTAEAATTGTISGTVTYTGVKTGPLYVFGFKTLPPGINGPDFAFKVPTPVYPQAYTITGIKPATYAGVFTYISTVTDHNDGPTFMDPQAESDNVVVTVGVTTTLNTSLDPIIADAGDGG
jgi:hypothetical protein